MWQLLGVEKIQNGGRCHGNQGIKWPPNKKILRFGRNLVMVVIHLCVKLSVFAVFMATAGILQFPSLKTIYTHDIQHFY
jgi:hypothetical protein